MPSVAVERIERRFGSAADPDERPSGERDGGPDRYERADCGAVFVAEPAARSTCERNER